MLENVSFFLFGNVYRFFPSPSETTPPLQISRRSWHRDTFSLINKVKSFKHRFKILVEQTAACAGGCLDVHRRKHSGGDIQLQSKTCQLFTFIW